MKEPTRVGQFDDMMYGDYLALSDEVSFVSSDVHIDKLIEMENEQAEQRIADSHDITKSNFGFK